MLPGIAYYLSRWYRRSELAFRLSLYIVMAPLAGAFGGLLASAILTLDHFGGLHTWRMIFAIEGIITCILALIGFITLTDRPETARWLTQEEKDLAIARVKSERVGTTEVLDKIDLPKIMKGIFSPVTMATAFIFLLDNITVQGLAFFAPTIVRTIYPEASVVRPTPHPTSASHANLAFRSPNNSTPFPLTSSAPSSPSCSQRYPGTSTSATSSSSSPRPS